MTTLSELIASFESLAARFHRAGHSLYLVGGVVRDGLLFEEWGTRGDVDLTTDALPEVTQGLVAPLAESVWLQGKRFGTVGIRIDGRDVEITTFRSEQYVTSSRKPVVAYSRDIVEDLSRRDFTINSMAISLPDGQFTDPFGGRDDLANRLLRTPQSPEVSFGDDPLRMLRAARFVAAFGLTPVAPLAAATTAFRDRLAIVSRERIRDELDRLAAVTRPGPGVDFLLAHGLLQEAVIDVHPGQGPEPGVSAIVDRMQHTDPEVLWTARALAMVALLPTRRAVVGWSAVAQRVEALRWSAARQAQAVAVAAGAAQATTPDPWTDGAIRSLLSTRGFDWDVFVTVLDGLAPQGWSELRGRMAAIRMAEGLSFPVPVTGEDVMDVLGIPEGRPVGAALAELRRARLASGPLDREDAIDLLRSWWSTQGE